MPSPAGRARNCLIENTASLRRGLRRPGSRRSAPGQSRDRKHRLAQKRIKTRQCFRYSSLPRPIENTASLRRGLRLPVKVFPSINVYHHRKHRLAQKRIKTLGRGLPIANAHADRKHRLAQKRIKTNHPALLRCLAEEIENTASLRRGLRRGRDAGERCDGAADRKHRLAQKRIKT